MTTTARAFLDAHTEQPLSDLGNLSTTTDWDTLVRMRGSTGSGSKPEQLIEEQMVLVYEQVVCTLTKEAIPPWLDAIMQEYLEFKIWPSCLDKALLTQRLESIL